MAKRKSVNDQVLSNKPLLIFVGLLVLAGIFNYPQISAYFRVSSSDAASGWVLTQFTSQAGLEQPTDVSLDKAVLVYQGGTNPGIYAGSITNATAQTFRRISTTPFTNARIYQSKVVWNANGAVKVIDLNQPSWVLPTPLTSTAIANTPVDIWSKYVVYVGMYGAAKRIYLLDTTTKKSINISQNLRDASDNLSLRIENNRVYWADQPLAMAQHVLYVYDILHPGVKQISAGISTNLASIDVSGNYAVGLVNTTGKPDNIFMYNAATGATTQVTNNTQKKSFPSVYGTKIIWFAYAPNPIVNKLDYQMMVSDVMYNNPVAATQWQAPTNEVWTQPFMTLASGKYVGLAARTWMQNYIKQGDVYKAAQL